MRDFLHHLFLPRESNNHRAKALHHSGLLVIICILFALQALLSIVQSQRSDILGIRSDITVSELISLTNKNRVENGLPELSLNTELSNAASQKATNMFAKNYWAHNGLDGTTPWVFVKSAGYEYLYAGENLARGFSTSSDVVNAWMDSPGHRENILSPNYQDIGFAIVPGVLTGDETVLVVQMFGKKRVAVAEVETPQSETKAEETVPAEIPQKQVVVQVSPAAPAQKNISVASFQTRPLIDAKDVTKGISIIVLSILLLVLIVDLILIERKKIVRVVAHNIDTMLFLLAILITVLIIGQGAIL